MPTGAMLSLPAGLTLAVDGAGTAADPLHVTLATSAPIAGVFEVASGVRIDPALHVTPHGTVTLTFAIDGTWTNLGIRFGVDPERRHAGSAAGRRNAADPIAADVRRAGRVARCCGSAAAARARRARHRARHAAARVASRLLELATALDLYANGFAPRTAQLRNLLEGDWFAVFDATRRNQIAQAIVNALQAIAGLPGTASLDGSRARFALTLPAGITGNIGAVVGFDGDFPSVGVFVDNVVIADVLSARLTLAASPGGVQCDGRFGVKLDPIGVPLTPRIDFAAATAPDTGFNLSVRPLASGIGDAQLGPLELRIAPSFAAIAGAGSIEAVLTSWALPLVAGTLLEVARAQALLANKLWNSGPTVQDVLTAAQLIDGTAHLRSPLPDVWPMVAGALSSLANGASVPIGDLTLSLVSEAGRLGVGLRGRQSFDAGDLQIAVLLGAPQSWTQSVGDDPGTPEAADGVQLFVLRDERADARSRRRTGAVRCGHRHRRPDGRALVDDPSVHMGGVDGLLFMTVETQRRTLRRPSRRRPAHQGFRPAAERDHRRRGGGSNPVVPRCYRRAVPVETRSPPIPAADIEFWYRERRKRRTCAWAANRARCGSACIRSSARSTSIRSACASTSSDAGLLVDGGVSIAGFTAQVDDLTLIVPVPHRGRSRQRGRSISRVSASASPSRASRIAGALVKYEPPIEYDGMLLIKIGTIGSDRGRQLRRSAGGWRRQVHVARDLRRRVRADRHRADHQLTALGLGVGLNRQIIVPDRSQPDPRVSCSSRRSTTRVPSRTIRSARCCASATPCRRAAAASGSPSDCAARRSRSCT